MVRVDRRNVDIMDKVWLAVIAGGQGTRLFPLSHDDCPKQFCALNERETFIQATVQRFLNFGVNPKRVAVVVTSDRQADLAKAQLLKMGILSINIFKIPGSCGYAGAMVKAAEFIAKMDSNAIIVNTPADQFIVEGEEFTKTITSAVECAASGKPTIVGVHVTDLVTFTGCGHASFDKNEVGLFKTVTGFVEKPKRELAEQMMREDASACNTGINVWQAKILLSVTTDYVGSKKALNTDELMARFDIIKLVVGKFEWHDCGTLSSLYDISVKTPNHRNASLGGNIFRTDCRGSMFITINGVEIYAAGVKNTAVVVNEIDGRIVVALVRLDDSQKVRQLAEDFKANKRFLLADFSVGARNNRVSRTNMSGDVSVGFVGVDNYTVTVLKHQPAGNITVVVSNDAFDAA